MTEGRYKAGGVEAEFEPGSRGRVLRNKLGITRVREMQQVESDALVTVERWATSHFDAAHRFTAADIQQMHLQWLGEIYPWAGEYRGVNVSKGEFPFAAAKQVPRLMSEYEKKELSRFTPCHDMDETMLIEALAHTHAELVLIHPFREGNGRCARLLAGLMALQAGLPPLDLSPMAGRGKKRYFAAVQSALDSDYEPMKGVFNRVFELTWKGYREPV